MVPDTTLVNPAGEYWKDTQNYGNSKDLTVSDFVFSHVADYDSQWGSPF
ncbi:MAG: hypothetical protein LIP01_07860 [Tannerellaceae bacterium]|nr:hypothetical protein [Tannerellaceae bacterium]